MRVLSPVPGAAPPARIGPQIPLSSPSFSRKQDLSLYSPSCLFLSPCIESLDWSLGIQCDVCRGPANTYKHPYPPLTCMCAFRFPSLFASVATPLQSPARIAEE